MFFAACCLGFAQLAQLLHYLHSQTIRLESNMSGCNVLVHLGGHSPDTHMWPPRSWGSACGFLVCGLVFVACLPVCALQEYFMSMRRPQCLIGCLFSDQGIFAGAVTGQAPKAHGLLQSHCAFWFHWISRSCVTPSVKLVLGMLVLSLVP